MQQYSTAFVQKARQLSYWQDLACSTFQPMDIRADEDIECSLVVDRLGPLDICLTSANTAQLQRRKSHVAQSSRRVFTVELLLRGSYSLSSRHGDTSVAEGNLLIGDSSEPLTLTQNGTCRVIGIVVPEEVMRSHIPMPELVVGRPISGGAGLGEMAASTLTILARQMQRGLCSTLGHGASDTVLAMVAGAYRGALQAKVSETATLSLRRLRIVQFVEANLKAHRLSPATVAAHFRISKRYVRTIFEGQGESLSQYILRRRLEEGAKQLRDPVWDKMNISSVACTWGFNSVGSFSRAFTSHHGVPPLQFRRQRDQQSIRVGSRTDAVAAPAL